MEFLKISLHPHEYYTLKTGLWRRPCLVITDDIYTYTLPFRSKLDAVTALFKGGGGGIFCFFFPFGGGHVKAWRMLCKNSSCILCSRPIRPTVQNDTGKPGVPEQYYVNKRSKETKKTTTTTKSQPKHTQNP